MKITQIDKQLRAQQIETATPKPAPARKPEPVHPDFFIRSFSGQDNTYGIETNWPSEEDESLYLSFQQGLLSLLDNAPPSLKPVEPRYPDIPEIKAPKDKVYAERDVNAHVPIQGVDKKNMLNSLGQLNSRPMDIGESKEYREQEAARWLPYEQEQQQTLAARKALARVLNQIDSAAPEDRAALKQQIGKALMNPDYRPVAGVDPSLLMNLYNGMERSGGNKTMHQANRGKSITEQVNQARAAGVPESEIIEWMIQGPRHGEIPLNDFSARDLIAQSAIDAQRADPAFLARIPVAAMNHIDAEQTKNPWTASEKTMLAHLYNIGGEGAVQQYEDLAQDTLTHRRSVEKSANLKGDLGEVLLPATLAGMDRVVKGLTASGRLLLGNPEPMKLSPYESDLEAYIDRLRNEGDKGIARAIADAAGIGSQALITTMNSAMGSLVGAFSSVGSAYQDALAAGARYKDALNAASVNAVFQMLPNSLDALIGDAINPASLIPGKQDAFAKALWGNIRDGTKSAIGENSLEKIFSSDEENEE